MIADEIVKAALLGTEKYMPGHMAAIQETQDKISGQATSKEDRFLKLAATALLYEEAGTMPVSIDTVLPECEAEIMPVLDDRTGRLLERAVKDKEDVILQYMLHRCSGKGMVVAAELVPVLLNKALEQKKTRQLLVKVCGQRGKWLCCLNERWHELVTQGGEDDVWSTGSHDNRRTWLQELRKTDVETARTLLAETMEKETAANRLSFLAVLQINLSLGDEPFLAGLAQDKSQKVQDAAVWLLKRISGSAINNIFLAFATRVLQVKEERYMLLAKKKVLHINEHVVPEEVIFKSGVEKVSSDKGVGDHLYILGQVLSFIDPKVLSKSLNVKEEELLQLILQHKEAKPLLPYLAEAAAFYKNRGWALILLQAEGVNNIQLLNALNEQERNDYFTPFITTNFVALLNYIFDNAYTVVSAALAGQLIDHLSKNPYAIDQPLYQRLALHMPPQLTGKIMQMKEEPGGDYQQRYFKNQLTEIMRVMELKNIIQ